MKKIIGKAAVCLLAVFLLQDPAVQAVYAEPDGQERNADGAENPDAAASSAAGGKTVEVEVTERGDVVFQAVWDNKEKEAEGMVLTSPSGRKYGTGYTDDRVTSEGGQILVGISDAETGIWTVELRGSGLGRVNLTAGIPRTGPEAEGTAVGEETPEQTRKISWNIKNPGGILFGEVFADTRPSGYSGKRIGTVEADTSQTGGRMEADVSMKDLDSGWYFIHVTVMDEAGAFTRFYLDEPVYHENTDREEALPGAEVWAAVTMRDGAETACDLVLTWENPEERQRTYIVKVWDADTKELLMEQETEDTAWVTDFPADRERVLAAAAYYQNGQAGQLKPVEVDRTDFPEAKAEFPEGDSLNRKTVRIKVSCDSTSQVTGYVEDEAVAEATGPSELSFPVTEGDHRLEVWVRKPGGNAVILEKEYYVDTIVPQLQLYEDVDGTVTSEDYIYVNGYSEPGAELTCNGEPAAMEQGYFSIRFPLGDGANEITLKAADIAGNESSYTAVVTRKGAGMKAAVIYSFLAVILTGAFIAGACFFVIKKRRTRK